MHAKAQWSEPELERLGDATEAQSGTLTGPIENGNTGAPLSNPSGPV
jgi:hypothetical protein